MSRKFAKKQHFFVSTEIQDTLAPSPPGAPGSGAPGVGAPGVGAPGGGGPPPTSSDDWDGPPGGRASDYKASQPGAPPRKGRIGKAPPAIGAPLAATPEASGGAPLSAVPGAKEETPVSQVDTYLVYRQKKIVYWKKYSRWLDVRYILHIEGTDRKAGTVQEVALFFKQYEPLCF